MVFVHPEKFTGMNQNASSRVLDIEQNFEGALHKPFHSSDEHSFVNPSDALGSGYSRFHHYPIISKWFGFKVQVGSKI